MNRRRWLRNFWKGFGSVIDLFPEPRRRAPVTEAEVQQQVAENIRQAWVGTGQYLRVAMAQFESAARPGEAPAARTGRRKAQAREHVRGG